MYENIHKNSLKNEIPLKFMQIILCAHAPIDERKMAEDVSIYSEQPVCKKIRLDTETQSIDKEIPSSSNFKDADVPNGTSTSTDGNIHSFPPLQRTKMASFFSAVVYKELFPFTNMC